MHISFEGKLAIWLAVLALAGAGLLEVAPERTYIGWTFLGVAGLFALFLVWHHLCGMLHLEWKEGQKQKMIALIGMIVGAATFVGFAGFYFWPRYSQPEMAEATPSVSPIEHTILLDIATGILPRVAPSDGVLHIFEIKEDGIPTNALMVEHLFEPNQVIDWRTHFPDLLFFMASKAEIISTTNDPVYYAIVPMTLVFREMIPDTPGLPANVGDLIQSTTGGIQMRSGHVIKTEQSGFRLEKIYPQSPYVVYFVNRTQYLVDIQFASESKAENFSKTRDEHFENLNIKLGRSTGTSLPPVIPPKASPSQPPQAPTPQDTPTKK